LQRLVGLSLVCGLQQKEYGFVRLDVVQVIGAGGVLLAGEVVGLQDQGFLLGQLCLFFEDLGFAASLGYYEGGGQQQEQ